jgi:lysophospholipase L1-like esterase
MKRKGMGLLLVLLATALSAISCRKQGEAGRMPQPASHDSLSIPVPDSLSAADSANTHTYLALGDSYTIGSSVGEKDRYAVQTVGLLRKAGYRFSDPEIIADNGWTTENLWAAIKNKTTASPYDVVTLLVGVNNEYQGGSADDYRDGLTRLMKKCLELAGNKAGHVIVISIPDYSVTPFASGLNSKTIAAQIDAFNLINYKASADFQTRYLNVTETSRHALSNASLIASDGLHFSGTEYAIWASLLEPLMLASIGK